MHNSKKIFSGPVKAVIAFVSFLLCILLLLNIIMWPYNKMYSNKNQYETVFIGASLTSWGVIPNEVGAVTGQKTYMLSSDGCPLYGRYALIKSAMAQESLKTVVVDVSYDILSQDMYAWEVAYQFPVIAKINSVPDKLAYAKAHVNWLNDTDMAFTEFFRFGQEAWEYIIENGYDAYLTSFEFDPHGPDDMRLSDEEAAVSRDTEPIDENFRPENLQFLRDMIELCQHGNVRIIFVTPPYTENHVWKLSGMDTFHSTIQSIVDEYGVEYYDFNLYKQRGEVFDDASSFCNENHLSDVGAKQYSEVIGEIIKTTAEGNDISDQFYDSYAEAKKHNRYAKVQ